MTIRLLRSFTFRLALTYMALFGTSAILLMLFIYWSAATYMARQSDALIQSEISATPSLSTTLEPSGGIPCAPPRMLMRLTRTEREASHGAMIRGIMIPNPPPVGGTSQALVPAREVVYRRSRLTGVGPPGW